VVWVLCVECVEDVPQAFGSSGVPQLFGSRAFAAGTPTVRATSAVIQMRCRIVSSLKEGSYPLWLKAVNLFFKGVHTTLEALDFRTLVVG
jgi:hypothetical protein